MRPPRRASEHLGHRATLHRMQLSLHNDHACNMMWGFRLRWRAWRRQIIWLLRRRRAGRQPKHGSRSAAELWVLGQRLSCVGWGGRQAEPPCQIQTRSSVAEHRDRIDLRGKLPTPHPAASAARAVETRNIVFPFNSWLWPTLPTLPFLFL